MKIQNLFLFVLFFLLTQGLFAQKSNITDTPASTFTKRPVGDSPVWPTINLASPDKVEMTGTLGRSFQRGVQRLSLAPYTTDWLLSDVSFKVDRIYTYYSGDVSGRFLELGVLTSPAGQLSPAALPEAIKTIAGYQKPDGHFGADFDAAKPFVAGSSEITMLWGNARMLVGLVTASLKLNDQELLTAARRLGDFYVNTGDQLCSPGREAEFRSTGSDAASYTCGYFPAMEGLVMLYNATKEERYLHQAQRMAEWFKKFDNLPIDHSHANLSAWRSILDLYQVTDKKAYLDEAISKWDKAVGGGFVWAFGGVGEHWNVNSKWTEGCSESDWLRFNLSLWRWTGETRYLDMAERLLENLYLGEQTPNGGFGMRQFDVEASGPICTFGGVYECEFCCSFHGPLGLYFLKSFLATGSNRNIYVNLPFNFVAPVKAGGNDWRVSVKTDSVFNSNWEKEMEIEFKPGQAKKTLPVTLWLRIPSWASEARVGNSSAPAKIKNGYIALKRDCQKRIKFIVTLKAKLAIEGRSFTAIKAYPGKISRFKDISMVMGSKLLFEEPTRGPGRSNLLATIDDKGQLDLLRDADGSFVTVNLSDINVTEKQILMALDSERKVSLIPWPVQTTRRMALAYNLIVVPANLISKAARTRFASRVQESNVPHYGSNLEKKTELWPVVLPWDFTPKGILIKGGYTGLIDGQGYKDYNFDFDVTLPMEGQGMTGWIVRSQNDYNFILFQIQSNDSQYKAPEFNTRPNTLHPSLRKNGIWKVIDPVTLPKDIRRGEKYHITTECRKNLIKVFLDGEKVYEQSDDGFRGGAVGFCVSDSLDQGLFENIRLQK